MSRDDFEERLSRLGARATAVEGAASNVAAAAPGAKRAGPGHYIFGACWGTALGFLAVYLNQNYDALYRDVGGAPLWAVIALIFMLVSGAALALMLVSGVIYALAGRFGSRRWSVILTGLLFSGAGSILARALMAAGY